MNKQEDFKEAVLEFERKVKYTKTTAEIIKLHRRIFGDFSDDTNKENK